MPGADAIKDDSPICPFKNILLLEPQKPKLDPETDWKIEFAPDLLLRTYIKYRDEPSPIGSDGIFKLNKNHHGLFQLCFMHPVTFRGFPFAYSMMRNADANSIENFFSNVKKYLHDTYQITWNPIMMIDKDSAERLACEKLGFKYFLCNFHDSVTFTAAINLHVPEDFRAEISEMIRKIRWAPTEQDFKDGVDALTLRAETVAPSFLSYFNKNWLCDNWREAFSAIFRKGKDGLWETNNFSEALFKTMSKTFFRGTSKKSVYDVLFLLFSEVIPYYVRLCMDDEGTTPIPARNEISKSLNERKRKGFYLFKDDCVESLGGNKFHVKSKSHEYLVNSFENKVVNCDCPYRVKFENKQCKHMYAVAFLENPALVIAMEATIKRSNAGRNAQTAFARSSRKFSRASESSTPKKQKKLKNTKKSAANKGKQECSDDEDKSSLANEDDDEDEDEDDEDDDEDEDDEDSQEDLKQNESSAMPPEENVEDDILVFKPKRKIARNPLDEDEEDLAEKNFPEVQLNVRESFLLTIPVFSKEPKQYRL